MGSQRHCSHWQLNPLFWVLNWQWISDSLVLWWLGRSWTSCFDPISQHSCWLWRCLTSTLWKFLNEELFTWEYCLRCHWSCWIRSNGVRRRWHWPLNRSIKARKSEVGWKTETKIQFNLTSKRCFKRSNSDGKDMTRVCDFNHDWRFKTIRVSWFIKIRRLRDQNYWNSKRLELEQVNWKALRRKAKADKKKMSLYRENDMTEYTY